MDWKIWHSGYGHFLIRDKKWVIIIFKWERIFSLVGSDFVLNCPLCQGHFELV